MIIPLIHSKIQLFISFCRLFLVSPGLISLVPKLEVTQSLSERQGWDQLAPYG